MQKEGLSSLCNCIAKFLNVTKYSSFMDPLSCDNAAPSYVLVHECGALALPGVQRFVGYSIFCWSNIIFLGKSYLGTFERQQNVAATMG